MTTATQSNVGQIGIAIQTGEGTAAGTATYAHPVLSGLPKPVQTTNDIQVSASSGDLVQGIYKSSQSWEADLNFWVTPQGIGSWLRGIMQGTASVSGTSDPYTHTFVNYPTGSEFVTLFSTHPGGVYRKFADGTINELTFSWDAGEPLKCNAKAVGYTPTDLGSVYTVTTTESFATTGSWFTPIGATFKYDVAATPAATSNTTIKGGSISITRDAELINTNSLNPSGRALGLFRVGLSLDMLFADYTAFKSTFYGGTSGTATSATIVTGAFQATFAQGPTTSANRTLDFALQNVALTVPDPPDVDPAGGALMVPVAGVTFKPPSGEIITTTLKSAAASY